MVKYETLYNDVKNILSEKRFKHSEGVVERAIEYAKIYGEDIEKVKLTAIAHDIAKEVPKEAIFEVAKENGVELDEIEKSNLSLPHGKLGASICKTKYGFTDDMVDAVRYHSTGRENMSMLEKIIYLADATEKNRKYMDDEDNELSLNELVELIKKDIDAGLEYTLKWNLKSVLRKNKLIHIDSVKAYNYYHKKLELSQKV